MTASALPLFFSIEVAAGRTIVSFHGELDMACQQTVEALAESLSADGSDVVFDLHDLSYMDSTGLLAIFDAKHVLNERGKVIRVVGAHGTVLKVIQLTHMGEALNLQLDPDSRDPLPTEDTARRSLVLDHEPRTSVEAS